jgi:DtxR family Mn-dependent transcriptional regulator
MLSLTEENYLKAIFHLSAAEGHVGMNELSKELGTKMSTANAMMKRLSLKGLLDYESYKPVKLTERGRREAALVVRRHRLTEMFLVEVMHFSWDQVHEIAEQMEHKELPIHRRHQHETKFLAPLRMLKLMPSYQ